ncbi:MAG: peptide chain release factor N(5)-glutamine methyltransferase [Terriglobales bacterium]
MPKTLRQLLRQATTALERTGRPQARLDAEVLLGWVLGHERAWLYAHPEAEAGAASAERFLELIARRAAGEPLQYLTGVQEFYGRQFAVSPAALIPRPETELVVEAALERLAREQPARVLDVGTGSGCIAVTMALERPRALVAATDTSPGALALARHNAEALGARVRLVAADLMAGLGGGWDLVVSNPPYVAAAELAGLQAEVRDHEPRAALVAGPAGTEVYARLIPAAHAGLRPGGWLVLELGYAAAEAVREMLGAGWEGVTVRPDLQGWPRVLLARRLAIGD